MGAMDKIVDLRSFLELTKIASVPTQLEFKHVAKQYCQTEWKQAVET